VYNEQTAPVKEYYQSKGSFFTVDGRNAIDEVQKEIVTILGK
jgi:adenylate kinase family enzyme